MDASAWPGDSIGTRARTQPSVRRHLHGRSGDLTREGRPGRRTDVKPVAYPFRNLLPNQLAMSASDQPRPGLLHQEHSQDQEPPPQYLTKSGYRPRLRPIISFWISVVPPKMDW